MVICSRVSNIIPDDRLIVSEFIDRYRPASIAYEDSWGYIIQATRHEGFKYYDKTAKLLIFFDRPNFKEDTLIIPNFFGEIEDMVKAVDDIRQARKCRVILKNVSPSDVENLNRYGFRNYREGEFWSPEAPYDDQTYPQTVIDLQEMAPCSGRKHHKLKNLLNRADRLRDFELQPFSPQSRPDVVRILEEKDSHSQFSDQQVYWEAHQMYLDDAQGMDRFVITDSGKVTGFIALSAISRQAIALCAAISDNQDECIMAWGVYKVLCQALQNGFTMANLGGSETAKVFEFKKQTFKPSILIERTHLVWDDQN